MKLKSNLKHGYKPKNKMENSISIFRYQNDSRTLFEHYTVVLQYSFKHI